ncbi:type III-A CRISPR-associated RAMP protein Csm3 [Paucidesulfovibrio longus]|uniref:type III-A CRISPR-associated RAMP protein Csm3 n=1 Tax=Paucidesulfovibrio longus TaxID=889 RepID=UPI0003B39FA4|nr:type III-A CRISPR-associated RAMP protein Csm3 [Paucidesulfovibrio longus]
MRLEKIKHINGTLLVVSGLHIGAGRDVIEIGGMDQPIIKHPITRAPYVPGSSIKGKMRSLLEVYYFINNEKTREFVVQGKPCGCGERSCPACVIFGAANDKKDITIGPSRLMMRDAMLSKIDQERFEKGELPMEVKYENIIHRVKGVAEHPRPLERIPAGVTFDFNFSFKVFEGDEPGLLDYVYRGLRLIELDALGGCGSRGCGQVRFDNLACDGQKIDLTSVNLD